MSQNASILETLRHHINETPWHVISYMVLIITFSGTYFLLKTVIDLSKEIDSSHHEGAVTLAIALIFLFLCIQVFLNIWTWSIVVKEFSKRHVDTMLANAKQLLNNHVQELNCATGRAHDLIPILKGDKWLQAETDVGTRESAWKEQILVVVPNLKYEMDREQDRYYKSIVDNLNSVKKPEFKGYIYILPDDAPVRQHWIALGARLRAESAYEQLNIDRLKCYFYGKDKLSLWSSMHGLLIFHASDISQCIAYQYLPPGSDQEYMNVVIKGSDPASQDVLSRCIDALQECVSNAKTVPV